MIEAKEFTTSCEEKVSESFITRNIDFLDCLYTDKIKEATKNLEDAERVLYAAKSSFMRKKARKEVQKQAERILYLNNMQAFLLKQVLKKIHLNHK